MHWKEKWQRGGGKNGEGAKEGEREGRKQEGGEEEQWDAIHVLSSEDPSDSVTVPYSGPHLL